MQNWIEEFITQEKNKNITTDINKKYMMKLIPMIDELLKVCNLKVSDGAINATAYDVGGVKKIVITFLEGD